MKLRVGLVGLGENWQSRHRPALKALSDRFEVRAICCEVAEKSRHVAHEFGAQPIDGFRAMIERDDIDAVLALAPDWIGPLPILAACEAGKAVYSASALDISPDQAAEIRRRVDQSGVAFMAELPRRFSPATLRVKELIATRLGRPRLLFCHERMAVESQADRLRRGDYCPLVWKYLMELVDWCRYLVGMEPHSVLSATHKVPPGDPIFYQMASLEFPPYSSGGFCPMAQISLGHYIPARWSDALSFRRPASIQICCENGIVFIDLPNRLIWFDEGGQHTESLESERPVGEQMLSQFHRSVTSLVRNRTDLNDAYLAMQIVLAANESARNGRRVDLAEFLGQRNNGMS